MARKLRRGLSVALVVLLAAGAVVVLRTGVTSDRTQITAYFANANGIFPGDEVRILGVPVGEIETIEPQPQRVKISFWVDAKYKVPAEAIAMIIAPTLVTARAIQLAPVYTDGAALDNGAVIPQRRTAVPVEWDDLRAQLETLADNMQPNEPGGVSNFGALVNTAADNLRGEGQNIRASIIALSQTLSTLGDHSKDTFGTVQNLATLVSSLQTSTDLMGQLNKNFATVTGLLANDPNEVGNALVDLNVAVADVKEFVGDIRPSVGTATAKLASISEALNTSIGDIKQLLHVAPTTIANFTNIYQPAQGSISGVLAVNNFADPISFICGAIQAASRLNAEQSAKLCVQYLAPIVKNRQYNFPPIGTSVGLLAPFPVVGTMARPNEITYSEDWMRPDYVPPVEVAPADIPPAPASQSGEPLSAEAVPTDPSAGLPGMMLPSGAGS